MLDIDDCKLDPCKNGGTCIDGINSFSCKCFRGFTGSDCSKSKSNFQKNQESLSKNYK